MSREVTVTTPFSRSLRAWNGEGEVLGVVPLLGAQFLYVMCVCVFITGFLVVGGLYSVTAWRENDREGHSVY